MKILALTFTCLFLVVPCQAKTIIVDDDGPAHFNNIQAAIDDSNNGDIILVLPGRYTGNGNRDIDFGGRAITVQSVVPEDPYIVAATIIDCNGADRGFYFHSGEGANSVLDGLTITNGYADYGGGIYCWESSPTIANCTISENSSNYDGGGVFCIDSSLIVTNCTFSGNSAANGAGMYNKYSEPTLTSCTFCGNSASVDGGGIHNWGSTSMIGNCTISANTASDDGGGIYNAYHISPTVTNCILWGNTDEGGTGESAQIQGLTPSVSYSCIRDDDPNDEYIPFGEDNNNIDDNPMFVRDPNDGGDGWGVGDNDDYGDLHLQLGSPCINAGDPNIAVGNQTDIDGQPRISNGCIDMGADEFAPMIVVTKPQGGEVWSAGSTHEIEWSSYVPGAVDILFSPDAGGNWQTIESSIADTGSYTWHLPDIVESNQCMVLVVPSATDSNFVYIESGLFTIHPDTAGPAVASKWKSLGGDFDRMGLSENYGPELGCVKWEFEIDGAISASVTVGPNDTVYVPCEDGNLYTLDANGVLLWSYDTNSPLISAPSIGPDGTVYVGGKNGKLYAIDIDGNLRWTHSTDGFIYSSPAVSADTNNIYVCSQDGILYALAPDGSELWSFETDGFGVIGGSIFASPAIGADGTVYIGGLYDPNLYALDPNNGDVKWVCNFSSGGWPFASPVIAADGTIYQTLLYDPNLYAINPNNGNIIWATNLSEIVEEVIAPDPPLIESYSRWFEPYYYENVEFELPVCADVYLNAQYNVSDSGWSEPALGPDGTVYVSFDDPYLRAVEPNGSIKWIRKVGPTMGFSLMVDSNSLIYAASNDSNLYVVDSGGFEVARFDSNDYWLGFPVISADNTIIVGDSRDNSMLISYNNNKVWAISGDGCEGQELDLYWQGSGQDLNGDGKVDYKDLDLVAEDWLECTDCNYMGLCGGVPVEQQFLEGDVNRDLYVDFADFATLANRWLAGY